MNGINIYMVSIHILANLIIIKQSFCEQCLSMLADCSKFPLLNVMNGLTDWTSLIDNKTATFEAYLCMGNDVIALCLPRENE